MKRWARCALGLLACRVLAGCAPAAASAEDDLQSVCGRSAKLQDVEFYDGSFGVPTAFVNRHRLAVGLLRWKDDLYQRYFEQAGNVNGRGWCTGTLIDDDLFLTAGHCLDSNDTGPWLLPREKGGVILRPPELARQFVVEFRFETSAQPGAPTNRNNAEVVRLEEHRIGGLDYAILRLSGHPGALNGVTRISPSNASPGSPIAVLQHPSGDPMKVGAGTALRVQGASITYNTIDTFGGSSGSGVLDARSGKLVGVHTNGGCTATGGENSGVTSGALLSVSDMLRQAVDRSRDFIVGDWDNDGLSDLAVFHEGCLYPDANHDGERDGKICAADPNAEQYFIGHWLPGRPSSDLAWRNRDCVFLDAYPRQHLCFPGEPFEVMALDWNGDGWTDLGIRRGSCIDFDTDLDGVLDDPGYCFGDGFAEDEYLAGDWAGTGRAGIAVRRGNAVLIDVDHDGNVDETRTFGDGGKAEQYLVGDWNGDRRAELAYCTPTICYMKHNAQDGLPDEGRVYHDFWSEQ